MIRTSAGTWYSPSDLQNWMTCAHRSALNTRSLNDPVLREWLKTQSTPATLIDPDDESKTAFHSPAQLRGDMHERAMLQRLKDLGLGITEIPRPVFSAEGIAAKHADTVEAMHAGVDVVFQATLLAAPWYGFADFLVRVDGTPSALGDYSYEVRDTKLARTPSASALLQMAQYGQIVETIQSAPPPRLCVWLGTGEEYTWAYRDAEPYLRQAQRRFLTAQSAPGNTEPEPIAACGTCRWEGWCSQEWGPHDLIHVQRLTTRQRALLRGNDIKTIHQLAAVSGEAKPRGMATNTFQRLQSQAAVQSGDRAWDVITPQPIDTGLASIPAPVAEDIYFDLEGDPFAGLPTLDYLWAYCDSADTYACRWAHNPEDERAAFAWFMEQMETKEVAGGDWHIYHYNAYETSSMRRIARLWPDEQERAAWQERVEALIALRFVDLYRAVEAGLRTQAGTTSLKEIEKLAGYDRSADAAGVSKADQSIEEYEKYVFSRDEDQRNAILKEIEHYNQHDVRATRATHLWLYARGQELSKSDLLPAQEPYEQSDKTKVKLNAIAGLRDALVDAASDNNPLPSGLPAVAARHLAHMLEWHRKEEAVKYLDNLRLKTWALEEADPNETGTLIDILNSELNGTWQDTTTSIRPGTEHESCLLDIEITSQTAPERPKRKWTYTATCRPGSWKIKEGTTLAESLPPEHDRKPANADVLTFDAAAGLITFATTAKPEAFGPMVISSIFGGDAAWDALMRLGAAVLQANPASEFATAMDILTRTPPLTSDHMQARDGESAQKRARRMVATMNDGVLPIQGPPGTGKTWVGAHIVCDVIEKLCAQGITPIIAVTANAHRVIDNMLIGIANRAEERRITLTVAHTGPDDKIQDDPRIIHTGGNKELADWLTAQADSSTPLVIGATKGAWALPALTSAAQLLIIDEAGQVSLADALAVSQCAPVVVALGDPQQLAAPVQAAHDESINKSLLGYLADDAHVLPDAVGVFLDESHRMHQAVCDTVSELAYKGALHPAGDALTRDLHGPDVQIHGTRIALTPGIFWIPVDGDETEEVQAVKEAISSLIASATITGTNGTPGPLTHEEILVVAPHNAHVNRLKAALPPRVRVGTVDLFQGQEANVVIFSMGRLAESTRDVGFLYEINRINVALSRARLMALVISNKDAVFPPVGSPDDLMLASRFINAVDSD